MATLPPFPVDDTTLDLLAAAIDPQGHGETGATRSSVGDFLDMMSRLAGSDPDAVEERLGDAYVLMRDVCYCEQDVLKALIDEVRRLRRERSHDF